MTNGFIHVTPLALALLGGLWTIDNSRSDTADRSICQGERPVCDTIVAGERELTGMLVSGDTNVIDRLFANDAVWTLSSGKTWTKGEAIAAIGKEPPMAASRLVRADVHQVGRIAVVVWEERWRSKASAKEERTVGTDTWLARGGRWQIIASQEARPQ